MSDGAFVPMIDDVSVYSCLDSPLYGSLLHVIGTTAPMVSADCAAIRVFEGPNDLVSHYTSVCKLKLPQEAEQNLRQWAVAQDSLLDVVGKENWREAIVRPSEKNRST